MTKYPFTLERRIAWGECDPARIYYTPRAVDYAVEAVEAWFEEVLQISWVDLAERYNLHVSFVRIGCVYRRPLVASQSISVRVWVAGIGRSGLTFTVAGEGEDGESCFLVSLVACLVDRKRFSSIPIPSDFRERIRAYQEHCGEPAVFPHGDNRSGHFAGRAESSDGRSRQAWSQGGLVGAGLFTRKRRVIYGECDASGIIHAPRVFDCAVEAVGEWYEEVPGVSWMDLVCKRGQGAPFVSASCKYLRSMAPGQVITMAVLVTSVGGASIGFAVVGYDDEGVPCFDARLATCFIDHNGFKPIPVPDDLRQQIMEYQAVCKACELEAGNHAIDGGRGAVWP